MKICISRFVQTHDKLSLQEVSDDNINNNNKESKNTLQKGIFLHTFILFTAWLFSFITIVVKL